VAETGGIYRGWGKRALDLGVVLPAMIVWGPALAIVAAAVVGTMGRPAIFRQPRPGLRSRLFTILKFRTMTDARDAAGAHQPDADRLTAFGRWLRSTSLDELPELFNVLKGDMSLVGPRPLLVQYLNRYSPEQARRHEVRPGLTGWAQVNGRNALTWDEKFRLDVWYVDHVSLRLDLKILFATLVRVVAREGISADSHATMDEFMGSGR
jgi:sugar transferase EpsL